MTSSSLVSVGSIASGSFDGPHDGGTDDSTDDSTHDDSSSDDVSDDHHDDDLNNSGNPDDSNGEDSEEEVSEELEAVLRGETAAQGKAEYEVETEHGQTKAEFSVRVAGADPEATYDVVVDGVNVGQVTTNEYGNGRLTLEDGDDSHSPLPPDFPSIQAGSVVTVGSILDGTFAADDHHSGDVNDDQSIDDDDIDSLHHAIENGMSDDRFDLDRDHDVDEHDASYLIEVILDSVIGDSNLDGIFDSNDLIEVLAAGHYEDDVPGNATWRTGDWNGDGDCDSDDLVHALSRHSYRHSAVAFSATPGAVDAIVATHHDKRDRPR